MKRLGLALSGGGVKGFAHVGIYHVLEKAGIPIDCISGASAGAMIGSAIANGKSSKEIFELMESYVHSKKKMLRLKYKYLAKGGLTSTEEELKVLEQFVAKDLTFQDLKIPFSVVVVDLKSGEEVHLSEGSVYESVVASCSLPGLYPPVFKEDRIYIDGGVLNNLPVELCRKLGATYVVAVDLMKDLSERELILENYYLDPKKTGLFKKHFIRLSTPFNIMMRSIIIMQQQHTKAQLKAHPPDAYFKPNLDEYESFDMTHYKEMYQAGITVAENWLRTFKV